MHERAKSGADGLGAFLRYGNLPVALIAPAFMVGTYPLLGLAPSLPLLLLGGCGAFLTYQLERVLGFAPEDAYNQPGRLRWARRHRGYIRWSCLAAVLMGGAAVPWLRPATIAAAAGLGLLSMLYVLPLLPGRRRLKTHWLLKPAAISGAWAVGGVVLPVLEAAAAPTAAVAFLLAYRFLFVLPNTLMSDLPDREGDARAGLHTVATRLSPRRVRMLAAAALVTAFLAGVVAARASLLPPALYVDVGGPLVLLAVVLRSPGPARGRGTLLLDLPVAWPLLTALAASG